MRILFRYVLREFLVPFFYCLIGFIGIYVMFELFNSFSRLMEAKPGTWTVVAFFAGYLSPYLKWLVPAALLLATLYTMWNFCRHSEITAMRASGIGFSAIVSPLLFMAFLMACGVAVLDEFYVPDAAEWAKDFRQARFRHVDANVYSNIPYYNQQQRRIWRVDKIDGRHPHVLEGVTISIDRTDGSREVDIASKKAEFLDGEWWLHYPQYQYFDEIGNPIPNPMPALTNLVFRAFPDFNESPRDFLLMNKPWEYYSTRDQIQYLRQNSNVSDYSSKIFDVHAKLAAPFSCLIITLFAIPFGVATGRQSVFKGVICAVGLFFAFYAVHILCMILAKNGLIPPAPAAWAANAIFLVVGLCLFWRQR